MSRKGKEPIEAIGYLRTSSATNVGEGKDSEARQRKAVERHAKAAGFVVVDWFYDAAVSGADAIEARPGFAALLARIAGNGVRTIIVETANPAKFPVEVQKVVGWEPDVPANMLASLRLPEDYDRMGADYEKFKAYLLEKHRA